MRSSVDDKIAASAAGQHALYFEYLLSLVGGISSYRGQECKLARVLDRRFYWFHPLDENMALHGLSLRDEYLHDNWRGNVDVLNGEASVLEVLVSLAIRIEQELFLPPETDGFDPGAGLYFERMLEEIGFFDCDEDGVDDCIDRFIDDGLVNWRQRPFEERPTLWEQVNYLFLSDIMLEGEEL